MKLNTPGKIIFSGEHSVVHGCPAIAAACSIYLHAGFESIEEKVFIITSSQYQIDTSHNFSEMSEVHAENSRKYHLFCDGKLSATEILQSPVDLLIHALHIINQRYNLPNGGRITLSSQIPAGAGMGSSAAAVTAVVRLLSKEFHLEISETELFTIVHECENLQHGKSSGLDPATILNGGIIYYRNGIFTPISLKQVPKFYLINTGNPQSSTGECVSFVKNRFTIGVKAEFTAITNDLYNALKVDDIKLIKESVRKNHRLLREIGVVPQKVCDFAKEAEESLNAAFKISGAGSIKGDGAGIALMFSDKDPLSLCEKYGYSLIEVTIANIYDSRQV